MRFLLLEFSLKGPCVLPLISSFLLLKEKMGRTLLRVTFYRAFLEKISSSTNDSSEAVTFLIILLFCPFLLKYHLLRKVLPLFPNILLFSLLFFDSRLDSIWMRIC